MATISALIRSGSASELSFGGALGKFYNIKVPLVIEELEVSQGLTCRYRRIDLLTNKWVRHALIYANAMVSLG